MTSVINGAGFEVREASYAERGEVLKLTLDAYSQYEDSADPEFWHQYQANIENTILTATDVAILIAAQQGKVAASAIYCAPSEKKFGDKLISNPYPELRLLSVSPSHRQQGLAALLVDECEKRARREGFEALTLHTTKLMKVAREMYVRRGYIRFEQIDFEPAKEFVVWGYVKRFDNNE